MPTIVMFLCVACTVVKFVTSQRYGNAVRCEINPAKYPDSFLSVYIVALYY